MVAFEGPGTIAALVLETIPGTAGILVPPDGYLAGVREICDRHGIVYVADEVMAGFGRAGEWFAVDKWDVRPDLIAFAKGSNSGYVPLGGVIISAEIAETFAQRVFPGGLTYSGHPLACAAAVASINAMTDEGIIDHARRLGADVLGPGLREIADRHPSVGEVRGLGVFWALDLVKDKATREMLVPYNASGEANEPMAALVAACKERGLLPFVNYNRLHVVPPCTIDRRGGEGGTRDPRRRARRGRPTRLRLITGTVAPMSYDIFFVRRDPGQTFEDALDGVEDSFESGDPGPLTEEDLELWDAVLPQAREILGDQVEITQDDEETRELTDPATGIGITLLEGELEIHVPDSQTGADSVVMSTVYDLARALEEATGLEGYDPQLDEPVSDTSDTSPDPAALGRRQRRGPRRRPPGSVPDPAGDRYRARAIRRRHGHAGRPALVGVLEAVKVLVVGRRRPRARPGPLAAGRPVGHRGVRGPGQRRHRDRDATRCRWT